MDKSKKHNKEKGVGFLIISFSLLLSLFSVSLTGCTVKAIGDPEKPITIKAHVVIDIRELKETANTIEDYVSGETDSLEEV